MSGRRITLRRLVLALAVAIVTAGTGLAQAAPVDRTISIDAEETVLVDEDVRVQGLAHVEGERAPFQQVWLFVDDEARTWTLTNHEGWYQVFLDVDQPGTHTVQASLHDPTGADTGLEVYSPEETVEVRAPPTAAFSLAPQQPFVDETVTFEDASSDADGQIVSREWTLGDGTEATGSSVEHAYAEHGERTVRLTVEDDHGYTDEVERVVEVRPRPDTLEADVVDLRLTSDGRLEVDVEGSLTGDGAPVPDEPVDAQVEGWIEMHCPDGNICAQGSLKYEERQATYETDDDGTFSATEVFDFDDEHDCYDVGGSIEATYETSDGTLEATGSRTETICP